MSIDTPPTGETPRLDGQPHTARSAEEIAAQAALLEKIMAERGQAILDAINNGDPRQGDLTTYMHDGGILG